MKIRRMITVLAGASLLAGPLAAAAPAAPQMTKGEAKLAKLLEGRVAGEPQRCARTSPSANIEIIDDTALVVGRGRTIYVNVPHDPGSLDDNDVLVMRKLNANELCRLDSVETRDRSGWFYSGNVFLNDFVPYTRVDATEG